MNRAATPTGPGGGGSGPGRRAAAAVAVVLATLTSPTLAGSALAAAPDPQAGEAGIGPEGWREDLRQFRDEVVRRDAAFTDEARQAALGRLEALEARLPRLSDAEVGAELARIAALAGNAHTRLDPLRNRGDWRRYPVRLWKFSDGWRVIAAQPAHAALLGAKVLRIGGVSVEEAQGALRPLFAGNDGWSTYMAGYSLTAAEALFDAGLAQPDEALFEVMTAAGPMAAVLAAQPSERRRRPEENWWHLAQAHPRLAGWMSASSRQPLVLREPDLGYAHAACSDGVAYIRLNRTADQAGRPSLQAWGEALLRRLSRTPPDRLVVDLRFNTGGDLSKALPFVAGLIDSEPGRRGRLAVLINAQTFSAGITQAAWLRQNSAARFVGEAVGDDLSFWAEGDNVVLDRSGLTARYSTGGHHYRSTPPPAGMADRLFFTLSSPELGPDEATPWSWEDFAAGRDPALEAVAPGLACGPLN